MSSKRDKKEEEDTSGNPYQNLDKTIVLQDARYFNQTPVNPRKCVFILTKILYLLNQGEKLTTQEATDAFFATTKLFQSKDIMLRRMVYLCIKELSKLAQDVIIVTSSLTKDMTGKEDLYRYVLLLWKLPKGQAKAFGSYSRSHYNIGIKVAYCTNKDSVNL